MPEMISSRESAKALINKITNVLNCHIYEPKNSILKVNDRICISCANYSITPEKYILQNISIKLDMGKSYAIIGPSGSGKSTLLRMLAGGIPDIDGSIFVDNHKLDLNKGENLISSISYIQQEAYIFNTTIQNNITLFKSVEDKILNSVIKQACLTEVIEEKGLNYCCGDNGSNLSGGEKQRKAIARCLLRDKNIILADEITSAIDVVSADKIYNTILSFDNKLRVVVTHKIEAGLLKRCDSIMVMNEGRVGAIGNYSSLIEKNDYFKELLNRGNICMEKT
jgi:ABC-type multidrug transport system fused ATPase/permease subunit